MRSFLLSFINDSVVLAASLVIFGGTAWGAVAGGLWGFVVGLLGSSLLSALFFGIVLVLLEINENMKGVRELLEQRLLASDGESAESFEDDDQEVGTFLPSDLSSLSVIRYRS